jgi:hypothetical protein
VLRKVMDFINGVERDTRSLIVSVMKIGMRVTYRSIAEARDKMNPRII